MNKETKDRVKHRNSTSSSLNIPIRPHHRINTNPSSSISLYQSHITRNLTSQTSLHIERNYQVNATVLFLPELLSPVGCLSYHGNRVDGYAHVAEPRAQKPHNLQPFWPGPKPHVHVPMTLKEQELLIHAVPYRPYRKSITLSVARPSPCSPIFLLKNRDNRSVDHTCPLFVACRSP